MPLSIMTTEYKYWKWTGNNPMLKSKRTKNTEEEPEQQQISTEKRELPSFVEFETIHREPSDKRSLCNERISNRYMVIQTPINPFLNKNTYLNDLKIQDTMLRPKDSNIKEAE